MPESGRRFSTLLNGEKSSNTRLSGCDEAQLLLIAGIVVAVLLMATYTFLASLAESVPTGSDYDTYNGFAAENAVDVTQQITAWNSMTMNSSLSWEARGNLSAYLWEANNEDFKKINSFLLQENLFISVVPNHSLARQVTRNMTESNPGVEYEAIGPFVLYNVTLYTGGGIPYHACAVYATCIDIDVYSSKMHIRLSEVVPVA